MFIVLENPSLAKEYKCEDSGCSECVESFNPFGAALVCCKRCVAEQGEPSELREIPCGGVKPEKRQCVEAICDFCKKNEWKCYRDMALGETVMVCCKCGKLHGGDFVQEDIKNGWDVTTPMSLPYGWTKEHVEEFKEILKDIAIPEDDFDTYYEEYSTLRDEFEKSRGISSV